jgi:hypothetical protein
MMRPIPIPRPHAHPPRESERDLLMRLAREGRAQDRRARRLRLRGMSRLLGER